MSDTREIEARLREVSGQHFNDRVALWHHTINAAADALAAMRAECERLREALIQADRHACMMRTWGGMKWDYHPIHAKRIHDVCEAALTPLPAAPKE